MLPHVGFFFYVLKIRVSVVRFRPWPPSQNSKLDLDGQVMLAPAELLNRDCRCTSLDAEALRHELESLKIPDLYRSIIETRPHLFSATPVFVSRHHIARMADIIRAIETVIALPAYQQKVLQWAPGIARVSHGPLGIFISYDFHLGSDGPQLIEINTNAGGALLNLVLARAQQVCCEALKAVVTTTASINQLEQMFWDMFTAEWRRQRGAQPLKCIAIIDDQPEEQYLYPEFLLFRQMLNCRGVNTLIAAPQGLTLRGDGLWLKNQHIDMIYNRLTDFSLAQPAHQNLRHAYSKGQVVLTPHPRAHALYANKRNLAALTDTVSLADLGVPQPVQATLLSGIAKTVLVTDANSDTLWQNRRRLFFKPAAGYGSRAAYRGDKLTKRVWREIVHGEYVAQALVPPSKRNIKIDGALETFKTDLRNYVYAGNVQLVSARLYQGQTTNFRTLGGGFSPVFPIDAAIHCG